MVPTGEVQHLQTKGFKHVPNLNNLRRYRKREQQALKLCLNAQRRRWEASAAARSERQDCHQVQTRTLPSP